MHYGSVKHPNAVVTDADGIFKLFRDPFWSIFLSAEIENDWDHSSEFFFPGVEEKISYTLSFIAHRLTKT